MRFIDIAVPDVLNARIRHLGRRNGVGAADGARVNHAREANEFSALVDGDLFFTHNVQVAVNQNLVNRDRQRTAEGVAGVRAAFTVKGIAARGLDICSRVAEQSLQVARDGIEAKIGFAIAAGVRRRALARADVFLQHNGQCIADVTRAAIFKQRLIAVINRLRGLENGAVDHWRGPGTGWAVVAPWTNGLDGIKAHPLRVTARTVSIG